MTVCAGIYSARGGISAQDRARSIGVCRRARFGDPSREMAKAKDQDCERAQSGADGSGVHLDLWLLLRLMFAMAGASPTKPPSVLAWS
jgi:hypothetical protein